MTAAQKTLVIHSGAYKTGSSAIQLYLSRAHHQGALAAHGVSYPRTGRSTGIQHGNLSAELRNGRAFLPGHGGWDALLTEMRSSETHTAVVSSEHFSKLAPEHLRTIGEKCRAAHVGVRWIHYVREQAGFYNSFYVERLVTMRPDLLSVINRPFEEFAEWSPISLEVMRYGRFAQRIVENIPEVELRLRPFVRDQLVDGDVVADFCATAGVPHVAGHAASTNIGTGWQTAETARRLTPLIAGARLKDQVRGAPHPYATRMRWLTLIRSELVTATTELGWNREPAVYLTPEFRARLLAEHHEDNVLTGQIGGFDWPAMVESEPAKPYNIGEYDDVPPEEVLTVVGRVLHVAYRPPKQIEDLMRQPTSGERRSPARRAWGTLRRRLT